MTRGQPAGDTPRATLAGAVLAEWTKLISVRVTWWALGTAVVLVIGIAALSAAALDQSAADAALNGSGMAQLSLAVLALLSMTSEYSTGSIVSSLQWVPVRRRLVAAKAVAMAVVGFVGGIGFYLLAVVVAAAVLRDPSPEMGLVLRNAVVAGGLVVAECLITLGLGTLLRSTAAALVGYVILGLVLPGVLLGIPNDAASRVADYLPVTANAVVTGGVASVYSGVSAWLVLAAWGAGLLGLGLAAMWWRDT